MGTTSELVQKIIETDVTIDLTPFILVANELVTECCGDSGYDDSRLELIERFLAAHFYTNRDPRVTSEGVGGVSVSYQSAIALGFDGSSYGQSAIRLDTKGGLAALNEQSKKGFKPTVGVTWLGKEKDELN